MKQFVANNRVSEELGLEADAKYEFAIFMTGLNQTAHFTQINSVPFMDCNNFCDLALLEGN
jgi:hypothetical protein